MKNLSLLLSLITVTTLSFAQNVTVGPGAKPLLVSTVKNSVQGSPYFNDRYTSGKIKTVSEKEFTVNNLRYNLETQQLEYTDNNQVYAIQDSVQSFTLLDSLGKENLFIKLKSENTNGFYHTLADGQTALLKRFTLKKEQTQDWYTKKTVNKNVRQDLYFTSKAGTLKKFIPSTKGIATVMADKKDQVTKLIKDEQLDPKQEDDLIRIFTYYNSLK